MDSHRDKIKKYVVTAEDPPKDHIQQVTSQVMRGGHTGLVRAVVVWCARRLDDGTPLTDTECEIFRQILINSPDAFDLG